MKKVNNKFGIISLVLGILAVFFLIIDGYYAIKSGNFGTRSAAFLLVLPLGIIALVMFLISSRKKKK